jgi:hypothetical protein
MAPAGVEGPIGGDAGDRLFGRDLLEQLGQHGRVAHIAGGELGSPDLQCLLVDPEVDPAPDAAFGASVLAGVPLAFPLDLDPGAVDQEVQRATRSSIRDVDLQRPLAPAQRAEIGHRPVQPGERQQARHQPRRLAQRQPKERPSRIRQVWIAASLNVAGGPRRPLGAASHSISGSNQICNEPRCFRAAL